MPTQSVKSVDAADSAVLTKEERIQRAIEGLRQSEFKNPLQAAKQFDIPPTTLYNRINKGASSRQEAHAKLRKVPPEQEEVLVKWAKFLGYQGIPATKEILTAKAQELIGEKPIGRHWWRGFKDRYRRVLKYRKGQGLDPKRAKGFNKQVVKAHLSLIENIMKEHGVPWENVYNMDEKGLQLGGGRKGSGAKGFYDTTQTHFYKTKGDNLELVTVIETVCADGTASIEPSFVLQPGGDLGEWFRIPGVGSVAISENGWTSNLLCTEWFIKVFVPGAQERNTSGKPIILIYDGHRSHVSDEMRKVAFENNIFLVCLPPKTTHKLQPLDVNVFNPIQLAWAKACEQKAMAMDLVTKSTVIEVYMGVRGEGMKKETILNAWRKSGHRPINPGIFTKLDYAPSEVYSTVSHAPEGYPAEVPTSPLSAVFTSDVEWSDEEGDEEEEEDQDSSDGDSTSDEGGRSDSEVEVGGLEGVANTPDQHAADFDVEVEPLPTVTAERSGLWLEDQLLEQTRLPGMARTTSMSSTRRPVQRSFDTVSSSSSTPSTRHITRSQSRGSSNVPATPEPSVSSVPSSSAVRQTRWSRETRTQWLEDENAFLRAQLSASDAHATLMLRENQNLREQLFKKSIPKKKSADPFRLANVGFLTAPDARETFDRHLEQQAEKAAEKAAETQRQQRRRAEIAISPDFVFQGSLGSFKSSGKKKTDVQELAYSLFLDENGTKEQIFDRIQAHFHAHPHLKTEARYSQLFQAKRRTKRAAEADPDPDDREAAYSSNNGAPPFDPRSPRRQRLSPTSTTQFLNQMSRQPAPEPSLEEFLAGQPPSPPRMFTEGEAGPGPRSTSHLYP